MTIELPTHLQAFVNRAVSSGEFENATAVVGAALEMLRDRSPDGLREVEALVGPAREQLAQSKGIVLKNEAELLEFFASIRQRASERLNGAQQG